MARRFWLLVGLAIALVVLLRSDRLLRRASEITAQASAIPRLILSGARTTSAFIGRIGRRERPRAFDAPEAASSGAFRTQVLPIPGELGLLFQRRELVPLSFAFADFDEDGRPDVVAGFRGPWGGVLALSSAGALSRTIAVPIEPGALCAGDFNGDGHTDVALADGRSAQVLLLLGDGRGGFAGSQTLAVPFVPHALDAAPRVGPPLRPSAQGILRVPMDLFALGEREGRWEIARLRDRTVMLRRSLPEYSSGEEISLRVTDWNADARADLLVVGGDRVLIFSDLAPEGLGIPRIVRLDVWVRAFAEGDFDGDRRADLALLDTSGFRVDVLWGASSQVTSFALPWEAQALVSADMDGDGASDLVLVAAEAARLDIWPGAQLLLQREGILLAGSRPGASESSVALAAGCHPLVARAVSLLGGGPDVLFLLSRDRPGVECPSPLHMVMAQANELQVTTTADSGPGSLRQALLDANASPGPDVILFRIPTSDPGFAGGVFTIRLRSPLPEIRGGGVTVDGSTQIAFTGATNGDRPVIVLSGEEISEASGLILASDRNVIRQLILSRFTGAGHAAIVIRGGAENVVEGCLIGTTATGTGLSGNTVGVLVTEGARDNRIGGTHAGARNVISANTTGILIRDTTTTGNLIVGNLIGAATDGRTPLSNVDGVRIENGASGNRVGMPGAGNIIVASVGNGVWIRAPGSADRNLVQANRIGITAGGEPLGNRVDGVALSSGQENLIGGTEPGEGNVIAYQRGNGIRVLAPSRRNRILGNSIFGNEGLGIDLRGDGPTENDPGDGDSGPNDLQNFPVIESAVQRGNRLVLSGRLDTQAGDVRVEFFASATCHASGFGEGERFLGAITVRATGQAQSPASFVAEFSVLAARQVITATATDAAGNTSEFSQCVLVNTAPIAEAGPDQLVDEGAEVVLDGTASRDPDGDPISFRWRQVAGPTVALSDATSPQPRFTAPIVDPAVPPPVRLIFELVVSDGRAESDPDRVTITVNRRPIANAGPDQTVPDGTLVTLDGTRSFDPDGDGITFRWTQTAGPAVALTGATTPRPSFTAPNLAVTDAASVRLTFSLVVHDGRIESAPDTVDVIVQNLVRLDDTRRSGNRLVLNLATQTFEFRAERVARTFTGTITRLVRGGGEGSMIEVVGSGAEGLALTVRIDVRRNVAVAVLLTSSETFTLFTGDVQ